jgi:Zn-dependent protease
MYPALIFAITFHEFAHAWSASKLGDNTAFHAGRVSLNPLHHIDPIGTLLMPLLMFFTGVPFLIGWAKPVPVNPYFLGNPKKDTLWISLAGPLANLILLFTLSILFYLLVKLNELVNLPFLEPILIFIQYAACLNLVLAFFNLIPIPPLDGSGILKGLLPYHHLIKYEAIFQQYGFLILIILLASGVLGVYLKIIISIFRLLPFVRFVLP